MKGPRTCRQSPVSPSIAELDGELGQLDTACSTPYLPHHPARRVLTVHPQVRGAPYPRQTAAVDRPISSHSDRDILTTGRASRRRFGRLIGRRRCVAEMATCSSTDSLRRWYGCQGELGPIGAKYLVHGFTASWHCSMTPKRSRAGGRRRLSLRGAGAVLDASSAVLPTHRHVQRQGAQWATIPRKCPKILTPSASRSRPSSLLPSSCLA